MSGSEEENEHFCFYGKPLEQFDEEAVPRKRPISVEEQIATDAQGRRRFHGAFTGGFSAGFFNTVGSLEGWLPGEFKSSRSEKSETVTQRAEDFMDDEDLGEDGIAPQVVRATSDYNTSRKRRKQVFSDGPIPGEPVLHNILTSGNETIGYMLLKNLRIKDKKKHISEQKTYGCQMPSSEVFFESTDDNQYEIPQIYKDFLAKPKDNTFGLGYSGLDKDHFSLFTGENKPQFKVTDKNKKFSISGQAFGVGAFEEEDDDIYVKEDMSKYDFEMVTEKDVAKVAADKSKLVLGMFQQSKRTPVLKNMAKYPPPKIPHSFTGKHKVKKSRFEPLPPEEEATTSNNSSSRINPVIRAKYLGEDYEKEFTASQPSNTRTPKKPQKDKSPEVAETKLSAVDVDSYLNDRFVSSSKKEDVGNILEVVEKTETIHGTEQMREAARMKMFGPLTRITSDWVPSTLLCKRFNVPEPFVDRPEKSRTRTKNIIFEYQKHLDEINLQPGLMKEETASVSSEPPTPQQENPNLMDESSDLQIPDIKEEVTPKEELQSQSKPIDLTEPIHLEQHQDLFKAIFLSDSESESEEEKVENSDDLSKKDDVRKEELKSSVLSDQLIPKIKPLKEGLLSGIDFRAFSKPVPKVNDSNEQPKDSEPESAQEQNGDSLYGPKMPERLLSVGRPDANVSVSVESESGDEWVEKDGDSNSDTKEKKKHKKDKKRKHKKHKHKKKK